MIKIGKFNINIVLLFNLSLYYNFISYIILLFIKIFFYLGFDLVLSIVFYC